jgi:hypothetical protein
MEKVQKPSNSDCFIDCLAGNFLKHRVSIGTFGIDYLQQEFIRRWTASGKMLIRLYNILSVGFKNMFSFINVNKNHLYFTDIKIYSNTISVYKPPLQYTGMLY